MAHITDIIHVMDKIANSQPIFNMVDINGFKMRRLVNFSYVYEFIKDLGKGAFGTVSCYREKSTGNLCALKEIVIKTKTDVGELQKEVEALNKLSKGSKSIVQYHNSFIFMKEDQTIYVIVTEYIDGFTFHDYLDALIMSKQTASPQTIYNLALWLFSTLSYIHDAGYAHRDIKPENIMIDRTANRFVLLDFGLTCPAKGKSGAILENTQGTPEFIAPERWDVIKSSNKRSFFKRNDLSVLKKSDIWSAGITIFCAAELRVPWKHKDLFNMGREIIGVNSIEYTYPICGIIDIIAMALHRDPNNRFTADLIVHHMKETIYHSIFKEAPPDILDPKDEFSSSSSDDFISQNPSTVSRMPSSPANIVGAHKLPFSPRGDIPRQTSPRFDEHGTEDYKRDITIPTVVSDKGTNELRIIPASEFSSKHTAFSLLKQRSTSPLFSRNKDS